jgi:tRNA modification GTPase
VPIHVLDTAGLRDTHLDGVDTVEKIGIERAWQHIETADVILFLHDLTQQGDALHTARDAALQAALPADRTVIEVWNKADVALNASATPPSQRECGDASSQASLCAIPPLSEPSPASVTLSAKTGSGLADLRQVILQAAGWQAAPEGLFIARQRHVAALRGVGEHLQMARIYLGIKSPALEVIAEELRLAQLDLNAITGEFTPDDLLGEIFSKFCIGK